MQITLVAAISALTSLLAVEASTLTPPVLPLIVRNPYLSTWLGSARDPPWTKWPMFWTGQQMGFSMLASIPDSHTVYPLLGRPQDSLLPQRPSDDYNVSYPVYLGAKYDASVTNLSYSIPSPRGFSSKPAELKLSFLSPISPTSTLRQSIPASYLTVEVTSDFNIDIYIDLNGQWVSGDRSNVITWDFDDQSLGLPGQALKSWRIHRQTEQLFTEFWDRAEWGSLHFTGPSDVSYESGTSAVLRQNFSSKGKLQNTNDQSFRGIMDKEPVFAFAKSFKLNSTIGTQISDSALFTIAHLQDPVIQFASARGLTLMRPLWASWFPTDSHLLTFHYLDFKNANELSRNYSVQLARDAYKSGADDYVDIVALSARQIMGGVSFSGTPDDPLLFLKEISSDGNTQTIDVIYPAFPFFLYTNPRWLTYMLEPLIEHMLSGQYPNTYAMHDLGTHFPNATGHPDGRDEYMPVEECGNILIMGLAIVNSLIYGINSSAGSLWSALGSGDYDPNPSISLFSLTTLETREGIYGLDDRWGGSTKGIKQAKRWVKKSYKLWKQWTGYLVDFSLRPENQLSTDDFAGWLALQTNLALKGIIGIKAMSAIAEVAGIDADVKYYKNISDVYITKWQEYGISRDGTHAKLAYDWYGSWTTIYNLYADALLCFHLESSNSTLYDSSSHHGGQKPLKPPSGHKYKSKKGFVPRHIYKIQSNWYDSVRQKYGLPLDSRHLYTKSDWEFFSMAVSSKKVRSKVLESVALWINETVTDRPFSDLYNTEGQGGFPGPNFFARPVVGGHFAFLALERACQGRAMDGLAFLNDKEDITTTSIMKQKTGVFPTMEEEESVKENDWKPKYGYEDGEL
ncbi:MAG: hypothetical protein M1834_009639 [Cirrosporium novae-zelandiae]|nr:MAG: hypothetical protein M1834_009639 [Cirrosporium novae-zelandiae]